MAVFPAGKVFLPPQNKKPPLPGQACKLNLNDLIYKGLRQVGCLNFTFGKCPEALRFTHAKGNKLCMGLVAVKLRNCPDLLFVCKRLING